MHNTGIDVEKLRIEPTDFVVGGESRIEYKVVNPSGDWSGLTYFNESQFKPAFDTMSCMTFGSIHTIERQLTYFIRTGRIGADDLSFLQNNGYIQNGIVRISKSFIAILSGTTQKGNTPQNVGDAINNNGLIPEVDLPFENAQLNSFAEYINPNRITQAMRDKGQEFKKRFITQYEWVLINNDGFVDNNDEGVILTHLKQCPLTIIIVAGNPYHCLTMVEFSGADYLVNDQYPPYAFNRNRMSDTVAYALKYIINPVNQPTQTAPLFTKDLKLGSLDNEVLHLQRLLNSSPDTIIASSGNGSKGKETNYFGNLTRLAVIKFQRKYGLPATGFWGSLSRAKANSLGQTMTASENGKNIIKAHEGKVLCPYKDSGGVWTIGFVGYGNTTLLDGSKVNQNTPCLTEEQANQLFNAKIPQYEDLVRKAITIPLKQNQFDALVSLCWNSGALESWFANRINTRTMNASVWTNYRIRDRAGNTLQGLINRRQKEWNLFNS